MATPDQMKAHMLETFAQKMELTRQLLVHRRAVEVTYMGLRREPLDGQDRTAAEQTALRTAARTLTTWNGACAALTHALYDAMFEWMDAWYADMENELADMQGHFAMRWAEWIRDRILELSPPIT